jgi:hypothetical protein
MTESQRVKFEEGTMRMPQIRSFELLPEARKQLKTRETDFEISSKGNEAE